MKVRAILEFDLVDENDTPIPDRAPYVWAAEATYSAIRSRLMGSGFLSDDTLIGTYTLSATVVEGLVGSAETGGGET